MFTKAQDNHCIKIWEFILCLACYSNPNRAEVETPRPPKKTGVPHTPRS